MRAMEQSLLSLVLKPGPELAEDAEALTNYEAYLFSLAGHTMLQLGEEPAKLNEQSATIRTHMQDLAFANYTSFINTSECIHGMQRQVKSQNS
jgi:hypothetical protein